MTAEEAATVTPPETAASTTATPEEGKKKGPSKKELKKLAKKAEKAKAKKDKQGVKQPQGSGTPEVAAAVINVDDDCHGNRLYLNQIKSNDLASLKACVASAVFDVSLCTSGGGAGSHNDMSGLVHGPVLTSHSGDVFVFGGNSIAKALSSNTNMVVDDWCEWERSVLRPNNKKNVKSDNIVEKLEDALMGDKMTLVGDDGNVTAADICIVLTLHELYDVTELKSTKIQQYVNHHMSSSAFQKGCTEILESLVPMDYSKQPSLLKAVESIFAQAITTAFPSYDTSPASLKVSKCSNLKFGDYQCSAAMPIFGFLKKNSTAGTNNSMQSPQQVASTIIAAITNNTMNNPVIDSLEVNGPGFILCKIQAQYLQTHIQTLSQTGKTPAVNYPADNCVVDFSSPNIAKEMHVGHLRSTIIGESICRILEHVGCNVQRVNHVGDWGTQFGMLIQYLKEEYPNYANNDTPTDDNNNDDASNNNKNSSIGDLTVFYKKAKMRFDEDEQFKETARLNVVKLQAGDEECRAIWKILCDISRVEFEKVYKRLDITVEECGESFYNDKIPPVIDEFENAGFISVEEGGAKCVFVDGPFHIPLMLQKSDGGYGYDSTDMAALKYRLEHLQSKRTVYITDFSQSDHFQMCFAAAKKIGWLNNEQKLEHIGFGTVMGEDGKRFKTRSGDTVRLVDLLDEAVHRMEVSLTQRLEEGKANITKEQIPETAAALGYGAVKYFDLRRNPTSNYKFSYDQMLDTKGNTAIYLLYAHARLESILTKAKDNFQVDVNDLVEKNCPIIIVHASERNLALHLQMFADTLESTLEDLFPYHICDYLYALSNAVSDFVTQCKVLGSPEMNTRLLLCRSTAIVMRQCFDLLGIRHVMRI